VLTAKEEKFSKVEQQQQEDFHGQSEEDK